MLHNSLFRRDLLLEMNRNPHILRRRDVHRNVGVRPDAKAAAGQVQLEGTWSVRTARDIPAEKLVAGDATDFLARVGVKIEADSPRQVLMEIGSSERGFRCVVVNDRVEVHAADPSTLWAGWVHLENQMRSNGGPILATGEIRRQPAWEAQIAPPTWGANYSVPDLSKDFVGDDTFGSLAHAGADGMFIYGDFLLYCAGTRLDELNHPDAQKNLATLRECSERAAAYGIKLYFVAVSPKLPADHALFKRLPDVRGAALQNQSLHCLCSSSADALGFHADVMGRMFRDVPEMGGLILIIGGESYYHCFMRAGGAAIEHTNCPKCEGKVAEDVIANLLKTTADAVRSAKPQAAVMAWPYSAQSFWSKEPNQLELIDRLPQGVMLLSEIDKDQTVQRGGFPKRIWDYSVDYDGHSDRIVAQALRCAQNDRGLAIKTETSHGIELLHLPYVPAIGRSAKQWQSVRAIGPWVVLQRWGFIGMYDSAAERIGYLARWDPDFAPATATAQVARQLCDPVADQIVAAWTHFDEAVHHIPLLTTGAYYCGPAFLGPCHPLPVWDPNGRVPDAFRGNLYYLLEAEASFTSQKKGMTDDLTLTASHQIKLFGDEGPADAIEAEFARARDHAKLGHDILQKIDVSPLPAHVRDEVIEQKLIGEYLYRTFVATVSTFRFNRLVEQDAKKNTDELRRLARDELANAEAALKMFEAGPWLNHQLRLDVGAPDSVAMLKEKIKLLNDYLAR